MYIINVGVWMQIVPQHNSSFRHSCMHRTFWCCVCHLLIQHVLSILVSTHGFCCRLLNVVFSVFRYGKHSKVLRIKTTAISSSCVSLLTELCLIFYTPSHTEKSTNLITHFLWCMAKPVYLSGPHIKSYILC